MNIETEKHLLVPINVQALAIGKQVRKSGRGWSDLSPDFSRLYEGDILSGTLTPSLTTRKGALLESGIHLHWALPDAMTHGRQDRSEDPAEPAAPPEFPYIPNRWMVQRIMNAKDTGKIAVRAWIIESDYRFGKDEPAQDHCVTLPNLEALPLYDRVGKMFDYSQWQEGANPGYKIELTALGYGDPAFAAYYPACRSLLGFHDRLENVPDNTLLTYMVAGWYSDAARDILYPEDHPYTPAEWVARLNRLKWSTDSTCPVTGVDVENNRFIITGRGDLSSRFPLGKEVAVLGETPNSGTYTVTDTSYTAPEFRIQVTQIPHDQAGGCIAPPDMACPARTLCHGLIYNIAWQGRDAVYVSQAPDLNSQNCRVAVGNSSGEALAALLSSGLDHPGAEDLLAAFQGDILAHNTDDRDLDSLLHRNRFCSVDGGRTIGVQKESRNDGNAEPGDDVTLSGDILRQLDELNLEQDRIARRNRILADNRWELYAAWYKQTMTQLKGASVSDADTGSDACTDYIASLKQQIPVEEQGISNDTLQSRSTGRTFQSVLQEKFKSLTTITEPAPPFHQANEPVILVAADKTRASLRHGHDGRHSDTDELYCRISGQETTAILVDIPNNRQGVKIDAAQIFDISDDTFAGGGRVPVGVTDTLLQECLMLDPGRADYLAGQAYIQAGLSTRPNIDALIADIRALQRPESSTGQMSSRSTGALPSPITYEDWQANPWLPLFLKWRLVWHSSYDNVPDALADWSFSPGREDYTFTGDTPNTQNETFYESYTLLTPHALYKFRDSVEKYNRTAHDPALEKILSQLKVMNILSQSLHGLQNALIMRDTVLQIPPIKLPPEDRNIIDPIVGYIKDAADSSPDPDKPFFPIRAGHARIIDLAVVDAFGRTVTLPKESLAAPLRAGSLRIDGEANASLIQFPPRVVRPMRLRFDWVPADNPENFPINSPICGWVMPNYLDKSLLIFDGNGNSPGAVQKILRTAVAGGTGGASRKDLKAFFWVPQPGTEMQPEDIPNPELKGFITFLITMDADTGDAFWRALDTALGKMDSGVPEDDPLLNVLVGRPLALVQAALQLEPAGLPAFDQAVDKIGQCDTGGIDQVKFPVLLGDAANDMDGLVGYFRAADATAGGLGPLYPASGAKGPFSAGKLAEDTPPKVSCGDVLQLTLLMDPLARVHVRTGILPGTYGELPHRWRSTAKAVKTAFFQAAPVICPGGDLRFPKPSDDFGKWSWACRPQVTAWKEYSTLDPLGDRAGFPPVRQELQEGWLKLKLNPVAIVKFGVREETLCVSPQTNITLQWLLKGGEQLCLSAGPGGEKTEELESDKIQTWTAPFPEQYRVSVSTDMTYTLRLTDKDGNYSEKQLTITVDKEKP